MRKKLGKGTEEFEMFQEYWTIIQNYYIVEDTEKYWEMLIESLNVFIKKYGKFGYSLAMAFFNEQDRKFYLKFGKECDSYGNKKKLQR